MKQFYGGFWVTNLLLGVTIAGLVWDASQSAVFITVMTLLILMVPLTAMTLRAFERPLTRPRHALWPYRERFLSWCLAEPLLLVAAVYTYYGHFRRLTPRLLGLALGLALLETCRLAMQFPSAISPLPSREGVGG